MDPKIATQYGVIGVLCVAVSVLSWVVKFLYAKIEEERRRTDSYIEKIEKQREDYRAVAVDMVRSSDRTNVILDTLRASIDKQTAVIERRGSGRSGDTYPAQR